VHFYVEWERGRHRKKQQLRENENDRNFMKDSTDRRRKKGEVKEN
jgi:hypothetical protein